MSILILTLVLLSSCASKNINKVTNEVRHTSALVERNINEIDDFEFKQRGKTFSGDADAKIKETLDFDEIISESIGELSVSELMDLGHVSEPITQAVVFCHQGKTDNGLKILNNINNKYSKFPRLWNAKGICFLKKNKIKMAKYYFDYALGIRDYPPALNNLAILYYKAGNFQKAYLLLSSANNASKLNSIKYNLALLNFNKGLFKETITLLKAIVNSNRGVDKVLTLLSSAYLRVGDHKSFLKIYGSIRNKNTFINQTNYALYLGLNGDKDKAINILKNQRDMGQKEREMISSYIKLIRG